MIPISNPYLEASILAFLGIIIANFLSKIINRVFSKITSKENVELISMLCKYVIYIFFGMYSLSLISESTTVLRVIALFFIGVIIILFAFSLSMLIRNLFFFFIYKDKFKKGIKVKYEDFSGVIDEVTFSYIAIRSKKERIYLPISLATKVRLIGKVGKSKKIA